MKTHHHGSKRQKLKQKYNIQKRVREHKRRMKKEAKKLGLQKKVRKDPGIPNSWPFKAEMLADLELKKEKKDAEMSARHAKAKSKVKHDHKQTAKDRAEVQKLRLEARAEKRKAEARDWNLKACRDLVKADVILHVLDARDPMGFRCAALESWAQEQKKGIVFVLAKSDLITPETAAKWMLFLGQIAPTVAVQAEAGREGIQQVLTLLGHVPAKDLSAAQLQLQMPAATAVAVTGYAGSGKRALCKAVRQEVKTIASWLLDACRLPPVVGQAATASSALHAVICGSVPRGAATRTSAAAAVASGSGAGALPEGIDPVDVIKELLARVPQQQVMRHYRLPTFEGTEGFLKTFCEDRKIKNKKGKDPQPAYVAQRILTELPALPGCFCMAPEAGTQGPQNFWAAHGDNRQKIQAVMEDQVKTLSTRGSSGPAATALVIASGVSMGPVVDMASLLEDPDDDEKFRVPGEDDMSDSDLSEEESGYLEGEEEEEELEGEESEEESMSDV